MDQSMNTVTVFSSHELKSLLTNRGVLFKHWGTEGTTKPFSRLWSGIVAGEMQLFELSNGNIAYRTQKSCAVILRKRPARQPDMLFESKTFSNGTSVAPRRNYSVSEKCRFLKGETAQEALARGLFEELGLVGVDTLEFVLLEEKESALHGSQSFPGLKAVTTKTIFEWVMPKRFHKAEYQEQCGYRVSTFTFGTIPNSVLRAYEARKIKRKVA